MWQIVSLTETVSVKIFKLYFRGCTQLLLSLNRADNNFIWIFVYLVVIICFALVFRMCAVYRFTVIWLEIFWSSGNKLPPFFNSRDEWVYFWQDSVVVMDLICLCMWCDCTCKCRLSSQKIMRNWHLKLDWKVFLTNETRRNEKSNWLKKR